MAIQAPHVTPSKDVVIHVFQNGKRDPRPIRIVPSRQLSIERRLPNESGTLEFIVEDAFRPSDCGLGADCRLLGVLCTECTIDDANSVVQLLARAG